MPNDPLQDDVTQNDDFLTNEESDVTLPESDEVVKDEENPFLESEKEAAIEGDFSEPGDINDPRNDPSLFSEQAYQEDGYRKGVGDDLGEEDIEALGYQVEEIGANSVDDVIEGDDLDDSLE